ncbi:hypothetical protein FJNA_09990 [Thermus sp. FJN-A]
MQEEVFQEEGQGQDEPPPPQAPEGGAEEVEGLEAPRVQPRFPCSCEEGEGGQDAHPHGGQADEEAGDELGGRALVGVEAPEEGGPHPEEEDEAQAQEHEEPEEGLPGPGAEEGEEGPPRQGHHDGGNRGDEPGAVGRLKGQAQAGEDQVPHEEAEEEGEGGPQGEEAQGQAREARHLEAGQAEEEEGQGEGGVELGEEGVVEFLPHLGRVAQELGQEEGEA